MWWRCGRALDLRLTSRGFNFSRSAFTQRRSTQPCIPSGSLNRVPASAGVKVGFSPLLGAVWSNMACEFPVAVMQLFANCYTPIYFFTFLQSSSLRLSPILHMFPTYHFPVILLFISFYFARGSGCEVLWWACLCVCLSARISLEQRARSLSILCACCLWPWLCPPLAGWRNSEGKERLGVFPQWQCVVQHSICDPYKNG